MLCVTEDQAATHSPRRAFVIPVNVDGQDLRRSLEQVMGGGRFQLKDQAHRRLQFTSHPAAVQSQWCSRMQRELDLPFQQSSMMRRFVGTMAIRINHVSDHQMKVGSGA